MYCKLLLTLLLVNFTQSQSITSKNLLEISPHNWPQKEKNEQNPEQPFYLFHQPEGNSREILGFSPNLFDGLDFITLPTLSFKYWTNSNLGLIRCQENDSENIKDFVLNHTQVWTSVQLDRLSPDLWKGCKLLDGDLKYLIAFKDIQVKYIEKVSINSLPPSNITRYKNVSTVLSNLVQTQAPTKLVAVHAKQAKILPQKQINFTDYTYGDLVSFEFYTLPTGQRYDVALMLDSNDKDHCRISMNPRVQFDEIAFLCDFVELEDTISNQTFKQLKSFTVTLNREHDEGFAMMEIKSKYIRLEDDLFRDYEQPNHLQQNQSEAKSYAPIYSFKSSPQSTNQTFPMTYLNLIDSQPPNGDICYTFLTTQFQTPIEIYLTLPYMSQAGIKLYTMEDNLSVKQLCLNDFVAVHNLAQFQLTLVFHKADFSEIDFEFLLTKKIVQSKPFVVKTPKQTPENIEPGPLTSGWFYYNRDWLDFDITTSDHSVQLKFWICDVVANCFAYDIASIDKAKDKVHYTIRKEYKDFLANSPFVKIRCSRTLTTFVMFNFGYQRSTNKMLDGIDRNFQLANNKIRLPKVSKSQNFISFQKVEITKLPKAGNFFKLKIPINQIDLRVFRLMVSIAKSQNSTNILTLQSLHFVFHKNRSEKYSDDLSDMLESSRQVGQSLVISTEQFFHVEPYKTDGAIEGYFEAEFEVDSPTHEKNVTFLVDIKLSLEDRQQTPQSDNPITYKILPLTLPKYQSKYPTLNTNNPKAVIITGLIQSPYDRIVPSYHIHVTFQSAKPFDSDDILIKQIIASQTDIVEFEFESTRIAIDASNNTNKATFEDNNENYKHAVKFSTFELVYVIELKNLNQTIWINVEHFEMTRPSTNPKLNETIGPVIGTFDSRYETPSFCPPHFKKIQNQTSTCSMAHTVREISENCATSTNAQSIGCSNIFDRALGFSRKYFKPSPKSSPIQYLPYSRSSINNPNQEYLRVAKPQNNRNFCVDFSYQIEANNSLLASVDIQKPYCFNLEFPSSIDQTKSPTSHRVCTSQLTNDVDKVKAIFFRFSKSIAQLNLDDNFLQILNTRQMPAIENILEEGIYQGKLQKTQFIDTSEFKILLKEQTIELNISELQNKTKLTYYYLRTKWFKLFKTINESQSQLRLTLIDESLVRDSTYQIKLILSAPDKAIVIEKSLTELNLTGVNVFDLPTTAESYYQLAIRVEIDWNKIGQLRDGNGFIIKLTNFSVNDPCLRDETNGQIESCSKHGQCERNYSKFECICKCNSGYSGKHCELVDYCTQVNPSTGKSNKQMCQAPEKCHSNLDWQTFECECLKTNDKWDILTHKCVPKEIEMKHKCSENQTLRMTFDNTLKCVCIEGYIESKSTENEIVCRKCTVQDKQQECKCIQGQEFDPTMRKCLSECSDEQVQHCKQVKNALSCEITNKSPICKCKANEIPFAHHNPDEWSCVPTCDLLNNKLTQLDGQKCAEQFQQCNPFGFTFESLVGEKIFQFNHSSIHTKSRHCECEIGFEWNSVAKRCELAKTPIRFIEEMQFDVSVGMNLIIHVEKAFMTLIQTIFNTAKVFEHETNCKQQNNDNKVVCKTVLATTMTTGHIQSKLAYSCHLTNVEGGMRKCLYTIEPSSEAIVRKTRSTNEQYKDVLMCDAEVIQNISVKSINYCDKPDRCNANYENSQCKLKMIDNESLFECICDSALFTVSSMQPMQTFTLDANQFLRMQSCKLKDLCHEAPDMYGCADPNAVCHVNVQFHNGSYRPESYCTCPQSTGQTLISRTQNCTTNRCDGFCQNGGECAQDVKKPGKVICHCSDVFTGDKCEVAKKVVQNADSNGFKIATIVLAILFGIAVLGFTFVLIRMHRSARVNFNPNQ